MTIEQEIVWLAGLLEGEAYFALEGDKQGNHNVTTVRVILAMTDRDVVERAAKIMGAASVIEYRPRDAKEHYKNQYRTKVSGAKAASVMRQILPFMGERRRARIEQLLRAFESRSTYSDGARARVARQRADRGAMNGELFLVSNG